MGIYTKPPVKVLQQEPNQNLFVNENMTKVIEDDLPLLYRTPDSWVASALSDVHVLLNDHAYLEKKAATNALDLLNRWPDPIHPVGWESALSSIARDEGLHLNMVTRLLLERGGQLDRRHKSRYASDLRSLVRMGLTPEETLDRLLVSALIEARSCERFLLLSRGCLDKELAGFYRMLWTAEAGHFKIFLHLAEEIVPTDEINSRWQFMLAREAEIIQSQPVGPHLHSSVPPHV